MKPFIVIALERNASSIKEIFGATQRFFHLNIKNTYRLFIVSSLCLSYVLEPFVLGLPSGIAIDALKVALNRRSPFKSLLLFFLQALKRDAIHCLFIVSKNFLRLRIKSALTVHLQTTLSRFWLINDASFGLGLLPGKQDTRSTAVFLTQEPSQFSTLFSEFVEEAANNIGNSLYVLKASYDFIRYMRQQRELMRLII